MEKIYANILPLIISCIVTYSLVVPTAHIFGLEDSTSADGSVNPSESSQSAITTEQTSTDSAQPVESTSKNEPQKVDVANSEQETTKQSEQTTTASSSTASKQSEQTTKASSSTDRTPPGKVVKVTVKVVSSNQIDLKWTKNKESDINHYNIYRGTKSSFKVSPGVTVPTGTSTTNSYSLTGLKPSTKYYVKIAAVDNSGNIGTLSKAKSGKTKAAASTQTDSPPQKVGGLSVSSISSTQLNLKWTANKENDFSHYNIYKGTKSSFTVTLGTTPAAGTSTTNSYSSTDLSPSTTYYYKVAAVDKAGHIGSTSSAASGKTKPGVGNDITPPAQVTGLTVSTASSSQLDLAWNKNSESDFNHYNIYRGIIDGFSVTPGVTSPVGTSKTNSYSSTGLDPSTKYYYRVAAVDKAGNIGQLSSQVSKTTATPPSPPPPSDTIPPAQVTGLTVTPVSTSQLNLAWNKNPDSDVTHYNVYRSTINGFSVNPGVTPAIGTSSTTSYSSSGLSSSTTYYYKVAAVDGAGNIGPVSDQGSGTTATPPPPPSDTTPPAQVTGLSVSTASSTQLNLAWSQNKESDLNQYLVYRGTSSGFSVTPGVTSPAGTSAANSYSSTGLSPSTTYYYKVAAKDNAGNIGPLSAESSATTSAAPDTTPPAQVTGLSVSTASSTQLNLAWTQNQESDLTNILFTEVQVVDLV